MATFCLTKEASQRFKNALRNKELDPSLLMSMNSEERRNAFAPYVGKANTEQVNALFESKLLLKNQKAGMISWAKRVAGITPAVKQDMLTKIERLDKALSSKELNTFLEDLVSSRLGIGISESETKTVFELSKKVEESKVKADKDGEFATEQERFEYGSNKVAIEKYVNDLKLKSRDTTFREDPFKIVREFPGALKSIVASFDNSFWGRQGIKTLLDYRTAPLWFKNFAKSFGDIGKELTGGDAIDAIKADIFSRPNSLNGKYKAGGYGLEVFSEEAYPSSLPEKIPVLGRLFKASEAAYNGGALRLRADLADRMIKIGEQNGLNMNSKADAEGLGHLVGSLTGRGSLGPFEQGSRLLNVAFFSVKFVKSNFDTLTAGMTDSKIRNNPVARREAAKSLLSITASLSLIAMITRLIDPEAIDEDPRSTNFGKIKMFGKWVDITGGMGGLVRLAFNLAPTYHDGKWSSWKKTSTGKWIDLRDAGYGSSDGWDTFIDGLVSNKLSPIAGLFRDWLRGQDFDGKPVTPENVAKNVFIPLSIQTFMEMKEDSTEMYIFQSMLLEALGFSSSTTNPRKDDWINSPTKEQQAFLDKVGEEEFKQAQDEYNLAYRVWLETAERSSEFKKLSQKGRESLITKAKNKLQDEVFKKYKFKYKETRKTKEDREEERIIKNLAP